MSNIIKLGKGRRLNITLKDELTFDEPALQEDEEKAKGPSIEDILAAEYHKGFGAGEESAMAKADKEYSAKLIERIEYFQNIVAEIDTRLTTLDSEFEELVISLASIIAEKVIRREADMSSFVDATLKEALKKVTGAGNLKIKVNPADLEEVTAESKGITIDKSFSKIQFEADERIEKGGCFIETEIGNVDARISTQLAEIKRNLELTVAGS